MAEPLSSQAWVAAWLRKASHDLETAERALHAGDPITDTAAYHCHQAAEKAQIDKLDAHQLAAIDMLLAQMTRPHKPGPAAATDSVPPYLRAQHMMAGHRFDGRTPVRRSQPAAGADPCA